MYRNGSAWVVHAIGDDEPNTAKLRWHQIAMNGWPLSGNIPTLVQSGTIDPDDASASALFPAIHVDDAGNMAITYNECSPTQHIAIRRTIRKHYDAPGTTRAPITVRESTASPVNAAWADYSQMDEDPANPGVMWSHLEWFGINAVTPDLVEKRRTSVVRTDLNKSLTFEIGPEGPIRRGVTSVHLETRGAAPGGLVRWFYSTTGCGSTTILPLQVTLEIGNAVSLAQALADAEGTAVKNFTMPADFPLGEVWAQSAEYQNTSEVVKRIIVD